MLAPRLRWAYAMLAVMLPNDNDWSAVSTAYGPATEVPALLAQLHAPEPESRDAAIGDLWGALCHQETVYEASALAAPYLFAAAREAPLSPSQRNQLLGLVVAIGRGEDTCWQGYTPWEVVQECASAVEALLPEFLKWAGHGNAEARRWAVVLATYFPEAFRNMGGDVSQFLTTPDQELTTLVRQLVEGVEPEASLIDAVAARDEDTRDYLRDGLASYPLTRQGRQVVWDLAEKSLL